MTINIIYSILFLYFPYSRILDIKNNSKGDCFINLFKYLNENKLFK